MTLKRDLAEKITVLDAVHHYHQPIFIKGEPKHDKLVILPNLKSILITVNTFGNFLNVDSKQSVCQARAITGQVKYFD